MPSYQCPLCSKVRSVNNRARHEKSCKRGTQRRARSSPGVSRPKKDGPVNRKPKNYWCPTCQKQCSSKNKARHKRMHEIHSLPILQHLQKETQNFPPDVRDALDKTHWSTLDDMSDDCRRIWESASIAIPRKVPSSSCWVEMPPTTEELFSLILNGMSDCIIRKAQAHTSNSSLRGFPWQ